MARYYTISATFKGVPVVIEFNWDSRLDDEIQEISIMVNDEYIDDLLEEDSWVYTAAEELIWEHYPFYGL